MIYWLYLLLAIVAEVIGTLSMKYASVNGEVTGFIIMYLMIVCSYFLLAKAIQKISLGIAYALWEGIGVLGITSFSVLSFGEPISVMKTAGLSVLLLGILLVKSGSTKKETPEESHYATA